jgi:hypothetical protein
MKFLPWGSAAPFDYANNNTNIGTKATTVASACGRVLANRRGILDGAEAVLRLRSLRASGDLLK